MFKNVLFITFLMTSFQSIAQYRFALTGTTTPEFNNKTLVLEVADIYSSKQQEKTYTAVVKDCHFRFEGSLRFVSEYATLSVKEIPGNHFHYLMIDSGVTAMKILQVSRKSVTYKNKLSNAVFDHSAANDLSVKIDSINNYHHIHFSTPSPRTPQVLVLTKERTTAMHRAILKTAEQYPHTFASLVQLYILATRNTLPVTDLLSTYNVLDADIRNSNLGIDFEKTMAYREGVQVGKNIAVFQAQTSQGEIFKNTQLAGKPYLLAFGATWCMPCKKNYPALKKIHEQYQAAGFEIVGINMDDKKDVWLKQINKYALTWINVSALKKWEETELATMFSVAYLPYYILVGKDGRIKYNSIQMRDGDMALLIRYVREECK